MATMNARDVKALRGKALEESVQFALDPPLSTPALYRRFRFMVQHAPYRLLFLAFAWLVVYIFNAYYYGDAGWFLLSGFALLLSFVNLIYPIVTRPLRRALIRAVDRRFDQDWFEYEYDPVTQMYVKFEDGLVVESRAQR